MYVSIPYWSTLILIGGSFSSAVLVSPSTDSIDAIASITRLASRATPAVNTNKEPETRHQYVQRVKTPTVIEVAMAHNAEWTANGALPKAETTEQKKADRKFKNGLNPYRMILGESDIAVDESETKYHETTEVVSLGDIQVDKMMSKNEKIAKKMDDMLFGLGISKMEKLFRGLMIHPPVHYSVRTRDEVSAKRKDGESLIFAAVVQGIMEALVEVATDSSPTTPIPEEKTEALRVAASQFANLLEEATTGSPSTTIAPQAENSENHELDLLPISAISSMVKEFGKIATETAKVVTKVIEDIEKIAKDAKERKAEHQGLVQHTGTDSRLDARFLPVPGLDPLTVAIHVMTAVFAEVGYNYYKSRGKSRPSYAQAEFKAQAERLAIVEEKLKMELLKNDALKKDILKEKPKHDH